MSPSLTKAEAAMLGRRAQRPVKAPGELLAVWVPGALHNYLNGRVHWRVDSRYRKGWHERVAQALLEIGWRGHKPGEFRDVHPKRVAFLAKTHNTMDSDGLQAAVKPIRDTLIQCGVIHSDAPDSGHEFVYSQMIDRKQRGCEIRVSLRD